MQNHLRQAFKKHQIQVIFYRFFDYVYFMVFFFRFRTIIEENQLNIRWGNNELYEKLIRGTTTDELLDF